MTRRPQLVFAVVAPALLMFSIDGTIVAVGLKTILQELHTTLPMVSWIFTGFQLAQTVVMPLAGKLGDDYGRKRVFLFAVLLFTLGSVGAGLAPNIYLLIVFRVVQAIGGGTLFPSAVGIVAEAFGEKRQTAIGLFTSIFPIGAIVGPNIGGFVIGHFSWRWIFFVNLPIGVIILVAGLLLLPRDVQRTERHAVDMFGVGLFAASMLGILYGMTYIANHPSSVTQPTPWLFLVAGVALFVAFVRHESHTPEPMIEIALLKMRPVMAANAFNFVTGSVMNGFFAFIPYYTVVAYDMSVGQSGAILTPRSVSMITVNTLCAFFVIKRFGYRLPMTIGLIVIASGLFVLSLGLHNASLLGVSLPNFALLSGMVALTGIGMGILQPPAQNAVLDIAPDKISAIAGMRGMFGSTGGVVGTAAFTLALSQFQNKAQGIQDIFFFLGCYLLLNIPLVFLIPESRVRERAAGPPQAVAVTAD